MDESRLSFYLCHSKVSHAYPCGYYGDPIKPCTCAPSTVTKYQKRISGPLLDRIDIHIEVPRVDYQKLSSDHLGEASDAIRKRVQFARDRQIARFTNPDSRKTKHELSNIVSNADMRVTEIQQFCKLDEAWESSDPCRDGTDESIGVQYLTMEYISTGLTQEPFE